MSRVIIVGAGGAGMAAAIEAAEAGARVVLVSKAVYRNERYKWASVGGCTWKTHAFNAAIAPGDTVEDHVRDTLQGGAFANDVHLAEILCEGSRDLVYWLESLGLEFDKLDGHFSTRPFGGCGKPRGVYIEDRLGFYIQRAPTARLDELVEAGSVRVLSHLRATKVLLDDSHRVRGLEALALDSLEVVHIPGSAVILADGGGASMYSPSAASMDKTCDGLVLGLSAGAEAIDMEFVQFHPTGLVSEVLTFDGSLVEEAIRFDGAILLNRHGERFMVAYDPRGEQATRDVVSRGIFREIIEGRAYDDGSVHLDITACAELITETYPALHERLIMAGYDPRRSRILKIRPTAHFLMGGLKISGDSQTSVSGLYAAGESVGGVHGANRLGGNGLSEALVFGRVAGKNSAVRAISAQAIDEPDFRVTGALKLPGNRGTESVEMILQNLRRNMYINAGPIRTRQGLIKMLGLISIYDDQTTRLSLATGSRASAQIQTLLDLRNLLVASRVIVEAALLREESRGSHFRDDYPLTAAEFVGNSAALVGTNLTWLTSSTGRREVLEAAVS